jgi:hypothetical protein
VSAPDEPASSAETTPKTTRGDREGRGPSELGLDQLLDELPETQHHLGRFEGYREGRRPRRLIALALTTCAVLAVVIFVVNQHRLEEEAEEAEYERLHPWTLPEGTDLSSRPRDFHMSDGKMRLALSREAPGIERIILPDKVITLAEGVDSAQIKVQVENGQTLRIKVLSGDVMHRDRHPDESF